MSVLALVEYEREEFCRFEDYGRYTSHLTRKLRSLRKSSIKSIDVLLFSAERAWSNAMHNKALNEKTQAILNRLRKASKHATDLLALLEKESDDNRLQGVIYQDYIMALLNQERGAYNVAVLHYSRALIALQNRNSSLIEPVEGGLRFSIYQSGAEERSINLQKYALSQVTTQKSQEEWRDLVHKVDPASLKEEKSDEMITSIEWAGRSAHLTNPELASSISTAVSSKAALMDYSPSNKYDGILAAWNSASIILDSLLESEEDQGLAQDLELIKAWLTYHTLKDRIARDQALSRSISAREGVLLCDGILRTYHQILALPGLNAQNQTSAEEQRQETKAERCLLLAHSYGTSLEALALINRALEYYGDHSAHRSRVQNLLNKKNAQYALSSNKKSWLSSDSWFTGDIKQVGSTDPAELRQKSVSLKPVVFDIAWNYIFGPAIEAMPYTTGSVAASQGPELSEQKSAGAKKGFFGGIFGAR